MVNHDGEPVPLFGSRIASVVALIHHPDFFAIHGEISNFVVNRISCIGLRFRRFYQDLLAAGEGVRQEAHKQK